jgi:membrane protease YdiL (CAAX protease family)
MIKMKKLLPIFGIWLFIVVVWSIYRYFFKFSESVDELVVKPIIFLTPVLLYLTLSLRAKKSNLKTFHKPILENLGFRSQKISLILKWGFGLGCIIVLEGLLIGIYKNKPVNQEWWLPINLIINLIISFATALVEEVLYRGFIMNRLINILNKPLLSNLLTSIMFCLTHVSMAIFILQYQGFYLWVYLWLMFILSLVNGLVYERTQTVYASTISHFLWNFSNTLFL